MRRASRQFVPNALLFSLLMPYISIVSFDSFEKSSNSGADICMRNASSYELMRDAISWSPVADCRS